MAGEEPRVAQAYIEIKARRAGTREDVKRIGEEFGREAGGSGGTKFDDEFGRQVKSLRSRRNRQEEGQQLGDLLGRAAGLAAGRHVADSTRAAVRLELKAAAREARVAERAAAAEARQAAQQVKAAERASAQAEAAFKARLARMQKLGDRLGSGISSTLFGGGTVGGSRIAGRLTSVAGIGAGAAGLSGLGTVTAGTVSAVTALSGLVGPLGAGLAAAGVGAGTLAIGIHGVGDAIADSGDLEKFNEDIKGLSPNARAFAVTVRGLRGDLGKLQNSVQDGLFAGLDTDVQNLADRYLPLVETGLTRVAQAMNAGARDVAGFLDTGAAKSQVASIFDDIGASAEHLEPALRPAAKALLDFIEVGSDSLPGLADDMTHLSDRFSTFISDAKDSGDLRDFFQGGLDAAGDLLDVGKNLGRVIGGIFSAGATGDSSALKTLADLTDRIADQVNKPEFQAGLRDFFGAIGDAGDSVGSALPDVADALVALEPAIAKLVRGSGAGLADVLHDAASAAEDAAPFLDALAGAMEHLAPHAGEIVAGLLLVKGALLGFRTVNAVADTLAGIRLAMVRLGIASATAAPEIAAADAAMAGAAGSAGAMGGALGLLSKVSIVGGVAALATTLGPLIGQIGTAKESSTGLADSLTQLGTTGKLGAAGLDLFGRGVGPLHRGAKDAADALKDFQTSANDAFGSGINNRVNRALDFGGALGRIKGEAKQLDPVLAGLAKTSEDVSVRAFEKFSTVLIKSGADVSDVQKLFPGFTSRLKDAGLTVDATSGKVVVLAGALRGLPASKTVRVNAAGMTEATARAYALSQLLRRLPTNKVITVTTRFYKVGREPGSFGNGLGVYSTKADGGMTGGLVEPSGVIRRAAGGLVDWRLGGPRQDNVPLLVSGREFVMNAYATGQPGVLDLLRKINTENRLPKSLATGGVASSAARGLSDISNRTQRQNVTVDVPVREQATSTARLHPDDIAALGRVLASAVREQQVVLSTGEVAGAVFRHGGTRW